MLAKKVNIEGVFFLIDHYSLKTVAELIYWATCIPNRKY